MNVDGSGQRRLTSGGDREFWPQWSPDGRRLAYMVWDDGACTPVSGSGCAVTDVWTVDVDGSAQRKVLDSAFQPRWSPNGSKLLFQRYDANPDRATLGVYVARSDGTGVRQLVRAKLWGPNEPLRRGPDRADDRLRNRDGRCPPPPSQRRRPQSTIPRSRLVPAWSPDGSRIAFTRRSGIWVIPAHGGRPRRIAAASTLHTVPFPAWSPAGKQLAYNSGNRLYVARVDWRSTKLIAQGATCTCRGCCQVSPPVWSRYGRRLYYYSD